MQDIGWLEVNIKLTCLLFCLHAYIVCWLQKHHGVVSSSYS